MITNPLKIDGAWTCGWTLDVHTQSSTFLGYDELGHPRYETIRTPLGELVYQLKYRSKQVADQIAAAMAAFLADKPATLGRVDLIVPVPPSTVRQTQPVFTVATLLANRLGKTCCAAVRKTRETLGLKNIDDPEERRELLDSAFEANRADVAGRGILLIDDLFRSGATANAVTLALIRAGAARVYFLAATRTRSNT